MSVQTLRYAESVDHPGMIFVPITSEEDKAKVKKELTSVLTEHFQKVEDLKEKIAEADHKIELADRKIEEGKSKIAEASKMREEASKMREEASKMREEASKMREEGSRRQTEALTTLFYRIFHGKTPVPAEQINSIFTTYLADGSISFDESKRCFKLNSMSGIVNYLKAHSEVKQCDLRTFKTEICDVSTLSEYLKTATVKAIAINNDIPTSAKDSLAEAVTARNGGFKVQYFA